MMDEFVSPEVWICRAEGGRRLCRVTVGDQGLVPFAPEYRNFLTRGPQPGGFPGLAAFPCAPSREFSGAEQRTARAYQAFRYRCSPLLARARSYARSMWRF